MTHRSDFSRWWKRSLASLSLGLVSCLLTVTVAAQGYPVKPIRLIIPYAPGGGTDQTGRLLAKSISARFGQPVIVENHPGAGGTLGQELVAKAPADGYTILFSAAGPLTVSPHTYPKLAYDPVRGFVPIILVATQPLLLVVNPQLSIRSVADLVRDAQAHPGKLSYASFGNGSAAHLAGEYFKTLAKVDMIHVPYKGSGPALVDLVAGHVDLMFDTISTSAPLAKDGKLRPIAITSTDRSLQFPDVPTMQQAGITGFEAGTWYGVLAPMGTPQAVIDQLSVAFNAGLAEKDVKDTLASQGATVRGGTPAQFQTFFLAEYEKWGKIVKTAGVKAD